MMAPGIMGFLGSILQQSPLTRGLMTAGQAGLMASRKNDDAGAAFLGVPDTFGMPPPPPQAPPGGIAQQLQPPTFVAPQGSFGVDTNLQDDALEMMLSDSFNPFGMGPR